MKYPDVMQIVTYRDLVDQHRTIMFMAYCTGWLTAANLDIDIYLPVIERTLKVTQHRTSQKPRDLAEALVFRISPLCFRL
jgi:hypothetical protein